MIRSVINGHNLRMACRQVLSNKGSAGIDGLPVDELSGYLDIPREALLFNIEGKSEKDKTTMKEQLAVFEKKREQVVQAVLTGTYQPQPILGVEIPKDNGGIRLLGIPKLLSYYLITVSCRNRFSFQTYIIITIHTRTA